MREITAPLMVADFFKAKIGLHRCEDQRGFLLFADEDSREGMPVTMDAVGVGIVFERFFGGTCCLHVVVRRPEMFTRAVIRRMFEIPFFEYGCEAVLAYVDAGNKRSMALAKRLGFEEVHRIPRAAAGRDLVYWVMRRDACRWIAPVEQERIAA